MQRLYHSRTWPLSGAAHRRNNTDSPPDCREFADRPFLRSIVLSDRSGKPIPKDKQQNKSSTLIKTQHATGSTHSNMPGTMNVPCPAVYMQLSSQYPQQAMGIAPGKLEPQLHDSTALAKVHIQNDMQYDPLEVTCPLPGKIKQLLPSLLAPRNPGLMQSTLKLLRPTVVYAKYDCGEGCRSCGICVHYTFVLGGRQAPDGLICALCRNSQYERPVLANRICPRHNKKSLSHFVMNLPEDVLATQEQLSRAGEIMQRSFSNRWDSVPLRTDRRQKRSASEMDGDECKAEADAGPQGEYDIPMPSIEAGERDRTHANKKRKIDDLDEAKEDGCASDKENDRTGVKGDKEGGCNLATPKASGAVNMEGINHISDDDDGLGSDEAGAAVDDGPHSGSFTEKSLSTLFRDLFS